MIIATKTPSFRFFDLPKKEMEIIEKTLPSNISKTTVSLLTHIKCFPKHPLRPFKSTLYKLLFHIRQAGILRISPAVLHFLADPRRILDFPYTRDDFFRFFHAWMPKG